MNAVPKATDFANSVATALPDFDHANMDTKHAESFRDLEGRICELSLMQRLAYREIESVLEQLAAADHEREGYDRATFAMGHLGDMIDALKRRYYAEFEAARIPS
jgi:hypothetical protein